MSGPPFRSVHTALSWAYRIEKAAASTRSGLNFTPGSDADLTRLELLGQAGIIIRHVERTLDPKRQHNLPIAFARFYYGRAATDGDLALLRLHLRKGFPEWAGRGAAGPGVDKLLMRFAGVRVGLHGIKRDFRCRFDRAQELARITHDRLQPVKDEVERRLIGPLTDAGLLHVSQSSCGAAA